MRRIRFSALVKLRKCRAAVAAEEDTRAAFRLPAEVGNDATALGHAYHAAADLAAKVGQDQAELQLEDVARKHGVEHAELAWLWRRMAPAPALGSPTWTKAEEEIRVQLGPELELAGTPDLVRYFAAWGLVQVDDYKTGRLILEEEPDAAVHDQIRAYTAASAVLAREAGFEVKRARGVLQKTRATDDGQIDAFDLTGDEIDVAFQDVAELALEADAQRGLPADQRKYRVGAHCRFCIARRACQAYRSDMQSALALVGDGRTLEVTTENAEKVYALRLLAGKLRDGLDQALKDTVEILGPIPTEGGKELAFRPYEHKPALALGLVRQAIQSAAATPPETGTEWSWDAFADRVCTELENRPKVPGRRFGHYKVKG